MKIPRVTEVVSGKIAKLAEVGDDPQTGHNLWYSVDFTYDDGEMYLGWLFPVPVSETLGATFLSEEKTMFLMRWIRKEVARLHTQENMRSEWEAEQG